jgi:hypothetical protein
MHRIRLGLRTATTSAFNEPTTFERPRAQLSLF